MMPSSESWSYQILHSPFMCWVTAHITTEQTYLVCLSNIIADNVEITIISLIATAFAVILVFLISLPVRTLIRLTSR